MIRGLRLFSSATRGRGLDWSQYTKDSWTNIPPRLEREWFGRNLLAQQDHPLARTRQRIVQQLDMESFESLDPVVSVYDNFDALLIGKEHVSRAPTDTYYLNEGHVLRTHTTAHQRRLLLEGPSSWVVSGDVYRRDAIDATHFPVFHQVDGSRIFPEGTSEADAESDLKNTLETMTRALFGPSVETRWRNDYFPFTTPSWELDVFFNGEWMEVLGSGLIHPEILKSVNLSGRIGWAFGMGLERLAMVLYGVKDIRTFWSTDDRFMRQFAGLPLEAPIEFQEYSKFPKTSRDISFWVDHKDVYHENAFYEIVREVAGDLVETVAMVDEFVHPKTQRQSYAFRIDYRSMERTLESAEINTMQEHVRHTVSEKLLVELR